MSSPLSSKKRLERLLFEYRSRPQPRDNKVVIFLLVDYPAFSFLSIVFSYFLVRTAAKAKVVSTLISHMSSSLNERGAKRGGRRAGLVSVSVRKNSRCRYRLPDVSVSFSRSVGVSSLCLTISSDRAQGYSHILMRARVEKERSEGSKYSTADDCRIEHAVPQLSAFRHGDIQ